MSDFTINNKSDGFLGSKNATLLVITVVSGAQKALNLDFTDINKNTVAYKSDEKFYRALPKGVRIVGK